MKKSCVQKKQQVIIGNIKIAQKKLRHALFLNENTNSKNFFSAYLNRYMLAYRDKVFLYLEIPLRFWESYIARTVIQFCEKAQHHIEGNG